MTAYVFTSGGFPASPVAGDTLAINSAQYDWNGTTWQARAAAGNFSTLTTNSATAPTSPLVGDRWFNTTNGVLVQYFSDGTDSAWLDIAKVSGSSGAVGAAATGGVTAYADLAALIAVTPSTGDMALVQDINKMFVYTGTGWFLIATVTNGTPSAISGVTGSYDLALDGTATVITAASTDPEGFPLTWSYSVTTGSLGSTATVTQADNVFTITPSTNTADAGTFSITFSVTDGATGLVTQVSNFELSFTSYKWHFGSANTLDSTFHAETTNAAAATFLGDFTVECFVRFTSIPADYTFAVTSSTGTGNYHPDFSIGTFPNGTWRFNIVTNGQTATSVSPSVNTWYHVALSKTATHTYGYIDGVLAFTHTGSWGANQAAGIAIGHYYTMQAYGNVGSYPFSGYINQCRMLTGTALYNGSNFTPPTSHPVITGTTVAIGYTSTFEDVSPTPKTMLSTGTFESSTK